MYKYIINLLTVANIKTCKNFYTNSRKIFAKFYQNCKEKKTNMQKSKKKKEKRMDTYKVVMMQQDINNSSTHNK